MNEYTEWIKVAVPVFAVGDLAAAFLIVVFTSYQSDLARRYGLLATLICCQFISLASGMADGLSAFFFAMGLSNMFAILGYLFCRAQP